MCLAKIVKMGFPPELEMEGWKLFHVNTKGQLTPWRGGDDVFNLIGYPIGEWVTARGGLLRASDDDWSRSASLYPSGFHTLLSRSEVERFVGGPLNYSHTARRVRIRKILVEGLEWSDGVSEPDLRCFVAKEMMIFPQE